MTMYSYYYESVNKKYVWEPAEAQANLEADGKCPDTRHPKSRGMRRTLKYGAMTRDEDNPATAG
jgi:hypothetical protein